MPLTEREYYKFIKDFMESDDIQMTLKQKHRFLEFEKRNHRQAIKFRNTRKADPFRETFHYRPDCDDSYYTKEFFDEKFTDEEKEEFINDQWRHINSPYDCTGMTFTQRIVICNFKEPNSFGALSVVYHFLGIDC